MHTSGSRTPAPRTRTGPRRADVRSPSVEGCRATRPRSAARTAAPTTTARESARAGRVRGSRCGTRDPGPGTSKPETPKRHDTPPSFPRKRDKFVWNEFEQPKVGPKDKVHGRTL